MRERRLAGPAGLTTASYLSVANHFSFVMVGAGAASADGRVRSKAPEVLAIVMLSDTDDEGEGWTATTGAKPKSACQTSSTCMVSAMSQCADA